MVDSGKAWEDTMLECFVRECHQINEDDDSMMRASSRQTGSNSEIQRLHLGSVVAGGENQEGG
jgi:hypothetical protein